MQRYGMDGTQEKTDFLEERKGLPYQSIFLGRIFHLQQSRVMTTKKRCITESKGKFTVRIVES